MSFFQAILLGLVQGVTEFLPVSSSGHLALFEQLFGLTEPQLTFNVAVHFATLTAIVIFFRREILKLNRQTILAIVVGTIPAVVFGLFLKDKIEGLFASTLLVGFALIVTGGINLWTDKKIEQKDKDLLDLDGIGIKQGLKIGLFQAVAIIPGISRSGSTVAGGISEKLNRTAAFTFSFLLGIPAIAGATLLQVVDVYQEGLGSVSVEALVLGSLAALISGYASLWIFKKIMTQARLEIFGWYCLVVGLGAVIFSFV